MVALIITEGIYNLTSNIQIYVCVFAYDIKATCVHVFASKH